EPAKAEQKIIADKDRIIAEINADYQKLYFGKKADGSIADLPDMTYAEVLRRMVDLMYVPGSGKTRSAPDTLLTGESPATESTDSAPAGSRARNIKIPGRWMDVTFRDRLYDFLTRTEARFHRGANAEAFLPSADPLDRDPDAVLDAFLQRYPKAASA